MQKFEKERKFTTIIPGIPLFSFLNMKKFLLVFLSIFLLSSCSGWVGTSSKTVSSESRTVATPTYGSGKHNIEIFADFQCPACINFSKSIGPILEWYAEKNQILITYRQYPLTQIHKNAFRDAMAALCAQEQGKYMDYKKALYALEESKAGATTTDEDRVNTAKEVGLDSLGMEACLATDRYKAQVESDMARGDSLKVNATPTVMLDGKKLDLGIFRDTDMFIKFLDRVVSE